MLALYTGTVSSLNRNITNYRYNYIISIHRSRPTRWLLMVEQMEELVIKSKRYDEFNDVYWNLWSKSKTVRDNFAL